MNKRIKELTVVDRNNFTGDKEFEEYVKNFMQNERVPVIIKSVDVGVCIEKWSLAYLKGVCGSRSVKVHVSSTSCMDFITKNFLYRTLAFDEFLSRIQSNKQSDPFVSKDEKYYLRTLGDDPRKNACDIFKAFPEISGDLKLPNLFDREKIFSSVFRIASEGLQLWTHYDVMDNILIGIMGTKKVVLFSPEEVDNLYMIGDKSRVLNVDTPDISEFPLFANVTHHECFLGPGDILFIPALWFHNVTNESTSVAVNVFWRHLERSLYDQSDVYGNKDLVPATSAENIVDRAIKQLAALPPDYSRFYARRLISKIRSKCKLETN